MEEAVGGLDIVCPSAYLPTLLPNTVRLLFSCYFAKACVLDIQVLHQHGKGAARACDLVPTLKKHKV